MSAADGCGLGCGGGWLMKKGGWLTKGIDDRGKYTNAFIEL